MNNKRACLYDVKWQVLRLSLKGKSTSEKLDALEKYWSEAPGYERAYRVVNYLDALINRGGVEDDEAETFKFNLEAEYHDFTSDFYEWEWSLVIEDLMQLEPKVLRALRRDIMSRQHQSQEALMFVHLIEGVTNATEQTAR